MPLLPPFAPRLQQVLPATIRKSLKLSLALPLVSIALSLVPSTIERADADAIVSPETLFAQQTLPKPDQPQLMRQGNQVVINGRTLPIVWRQWLLGKDPGRTYTGLSDTGLMQMGVELLNTADPQRQPIQWFSSPIQSAAVWFTGPYRYVDIAELAQRLGWQMEAKGNVLQIQASPAKVSEMRQGKQPWGYRTVIDLDQPTLWQVNHQGDNFTITLEATAEPTLVQRFRPVLPPPTPSADPENSAAKSLRQAQKPKSTAPAVPPKPKPAPSAPAVPQVQLEVVQNQTKIQLQIPSGLQPQVWTLPSPNRLVIDFRPEAIAPKDILWAPGLRWQQRTVRLGTQQFPVVLLAIAPKSSSVALKPIWSQPDSMTGTAPLIQTASLWQAAGAINAGFFNRNNQLPLGAIRHQGQWLSGPILNRGAIAWNDAGEFRFDRLRLQETVTPPSGQALPILFLNSGYVQAGLARYTPAWGGTYTPLIDNEIIVTVQNDQVTNQQPGGGVGKTAFPIPKDGYLLALRANAAVAPSMPVGAKLRLNAATTPADLNRYPHTLGAGPLLIKDRRIVLDAKAEQFTDAFIRQAAARSAIGQMADGTILLAAVHNRLGGLGPTLPEMAQIMQHLGSVDALNLDGGSSTALYLGGHLLNRPPWTAARVHNGLGIFVQPSP